MESDNEFLSGLSSEEGDVVEVESDASFGDDGERYPMSSVVLQFDPSRPQG